MLSGMWSLLFVNACFENGDNACISGYAPIMRLADLDSNKTSIPLAEYGFC